MTDLTSIVAAQVEDLKVLHAARQVPIEIRLIEYVLGITSGVAIACLVVMLAQGFTPYDGAHVPPLLPSST